MLMIQCVVIDSLLSNVQGEYSWYLEVGIKRRSHTFQTTIVYRIAHLVCIKLILSLSVRDSSSLKDASLRGLRIALACLLCTFSVI